MRSRDKHVPTPSAAARLARTSGPLILAAGRRSKLARDLPGTGSKTRRLYSLQGILSCFGVGSGPEIAPPCRTCLNSLNGLYSKKAPASLRSVVGISDRI